MRVWQEIRSDPKGDSKGRGLRGSRDLRLLPKAGRDSIRREKVKGIKVAFDAPSEYTKGGVPYKGGGGEVKR